jgi:hypothetical protein
MNWEKILLAFRDDAFSNYYFGLTPRFILGACQNPIGKKFESESIAREKMKDLYDEMKNYKKNNLIVTSNICEIHNGPVMRLTDCKWTESTIGTTFEEIWRRYGSEITEGNYHINNEEIRILNNIFK